MDDQINRNDVNPPPGTPGRLGSCQDWEEFLLSPGGRHITIRNRKSEINEEETETGVEVSQDQNSQSQEVTFVDAWTHFNSAEPEEVHESPMPVAVLQQEDFPDAVGTVASAETAGVLNGNAVEIREVDYFGQNERTNTLEAQNIQCSVVRQCRSASQSEVTVNVKVELPEGTIVVTEIAMMLGAQGIFTDGEDAIVSVENHCAQEPYRGPSGSKDTYPMMVSESSTPKLKWKEAASTKTSELRRTQSERLKAETNQARGRFQRNSKQHPGVIQKSLIPRSSSLLSSAAGDNVLPFNVTPLKAHTGIRLQKGIPATKPRPFKLTNSPKD